MIRFASLALLLPALAFAQPARAELVMLDRIAAVVDDSVIMTSELEARVADIRRSISAEGRPAPPDDILATQVLERIIVERIQAEQANRLGIRIDDTSLNEALTGIARQNGFSLEEFAAHLTAEGYQWAAFREQLRSEMAINQLRQRRVSQRIRITDGELDRFISSEQGRKLFEAEFRLGHIMVAIPAGASADQFRTAEQRANDIIRRLQEGADFSAQAAEYSDGQSALEGGDRSVG